METIKVKYKITLKEGKILTEIMDVICRDISWGTFIPDLSAAKNSIEKNKKNGIYNPNKYQPSYTIDQDNLVELEFNSEIFNFEREGINHFIGTIAGDITTNKDIQNIEIVDIVFNKTNLNEFFKGPKSGIDILRNEILAPTLNGEERPIVAFTIKPRLGLTINQYKQIILEASKSDIDIIEDDERLVDPDYCKFDDRVRVIGEIIKNGCKSNFSVNVTGNPDLLENKIENAYSNGIRMFKLDVLVAGFDTLIKLRNILENYPKTAITVFPDIKFYRNLNRKVILDLSRLCGADIIYAKSTELSRMGEVTVLSGDIIRDINEIIGLHKSLLQDFQNTKIKTTLPTLTHDINPKNVEILVHCMRIQNHYNYALFIGGGISGFPGNISIEKACKYWMKLIKYASKTNIRGIRTMEDLKKIDHFKETEKYKEGLYEIQKYLIK